MTDYKKLAKDFLNPPFSYDGRGCIDDPNGPVLNLSSADQAFCEEMLSEDGEQKLQNEIAEIVVEALNQYFFRSGDQLPWRKFTDAEDAYRDSPVDEILIWDGCSFFVDHIDVCADTGAYYMANGSEPLLWMPLCADEMPELKGEHNE